MTRDTYRIGRIPTATLTAFLLIVLLIASPSRAQTPQGDESQKAAAARFPRGKKLMLKDGSFHVVREYEKNGDRVRYYSLERSQWEEIPAALINWEETQRVADEEREKGEALLAKIKTQEKARIPQIDIDASVEVGPGIFLPAGEGLFVFDGKKIDGEKVKRLVEANTNTKVDKRKAAVNIILRVPIPTSRIVSLPGNRAAFRSANGQLEFYLRTKDKSEPNLELIRTVVRKKTRQIERIDEFFGQQRVKNDVVTKQLWQIAEGLYRITLGSNLAPGEYVIAQIIEGKKTDILLFWDFGIDPENTANQKKK